MLTNPRRRRNNDPVAARDFIGSIQRNANRLGNLISDGLHLAN